VQLPQDVLFSLHLYRIASHIQSTENLKTIEDTTYTTIKSILECTNSDISSRLGVDQYIAQIIFEEAKRVTTEMTKLPPVLNDSTFTAPAVAIKKGETL